MTEQIPYHFLFCYYELCLKKRIGIDNLCVQDTLHFFFYSKDDDGYLNLKKGCSEKED